MSGEFLIRGMFDGAVLPLTLLWHTGDFELDELYPNAHVCPALAELQRAAMESREWAQVEESDWVKDLNRRMAAELPGYSWEHMLDCLGTTACTGTRRRKGRNGKEGGRARASSPLTRLFPPTHQRQTGPSPAPCRAKRTTTP